MDDRMTQKKAKMTKMKRINIAIKSYLQDVCEGQYDELGDEVAAFKRLAIRFVKLKENKK